mgnify:CR=1 FL=1
MRGPSKRNDQGCLLQGRHPFVVSDRLQGRDGPPAAPPRAYAGAAPHRTLKPDQSQVWEETSEVADNPFWAFSATSSAVSTYPVSSSLVAAANTTP